MKRKTTLAILASLFSSLSFSVAQAINEIPVEGKEYNEHVSYDGENHSKNFFIDFNSGTHNFYFKEGATLDASNGLKGATISAIGTQGATVQPKVNYNIGEGKQFTIKNYEGLGAFDVRNGAAVQINGGDIRLESGVPAAKELDDPSAIYVHDGGNLTINANSLWIGRDNAEHADLKDTKAINLLFDANNSVHGNVNIDVDSTVTFDNVVRGISLSQTAHNAACLVNIQAGSDITINANPEKAYLESNWGDSWTDAGVGISSFSSYHDSYSNNQKKISITSKTGSITIKGSGSGIEINDNTSIKLQAAKEIKIHGELGTGLSVNNHNYNRDGIIDLSANTIDIKGAANGIFFSAGKITTQSESLKISNINGDYNYDRSPEAIFIDVGSADFTAKKAVFDGDIMVSSADATISADETLINGRVTSDNKNSITFNSREKDGNGKTTIIWPKKEQGEESEKNDPWYRTKAAVFASGRKRFDEKAEATILFRQATYIYAQGDKLYHADTHGVQKQLAILSLYVSDITLDKAAAIYGDIAAGIGVYFGPSDSPRSDFPGGTINITSLKGAEFKGDVLAGNEGMVNFILNDSTYEGNIDNYDDPTRDIVFRTREFSTEMLPITKGGTVNLTLNNSTWTAHGQNFVTNVQFGQQGGVIDLSQGTGSQSVTMQKLSGDGTFNMRLNSADHASGDMLYIGRNVGHQTINIVGGITGGLDNISKENPLRFATVGIDEDSLPDVKNSGIRAFTRDAGVWDLEYTVAKEMFNKDDTENEKYNGKGNGKGTDKPGNDFVENVLVGDNDKAVNWIITGVKEPEETPDPDIPDNPSDHKDPDTPDNPNPLKTRVSDAGKTILAMSKVNYSNAVYMDRLNKRMGEARYIDGDEGLWVRMRHDRIGKSDAFRSKNTMMELGYDKKVGDREDGEHRQGIVFDYMRGTARYDNVAGDGDVRRGGVWLYDTWLGDKGHYTDYVLKFGRLSNDFEVYARSTGEKITGDYSNFVYSASAEYGRKKDLGSSWYIEPQAQLQYAHVTDADYTTSQGTEVDLDAIDSLIGRIGFHLGKDVGENNTFYIKADILHEFLGDQDIKAHDVTGRLSTTYENKGTWYDVGLGFSHQFSAGTYMFFDVEKTFGHDNEDTYQFNMGMNWKV